MGKISANEFARKQNILVNGQPCTIMDVHYATPSARGASTLVKVKLRNLLTGLVQEESFKTSEKFDEPDVELIPAVFLYSQDGQCHFMDNTLYDQFALNEKALGDKKSYLKENGEVQAFKFNGNVISIELPPAVILAVQETEPSIKGASASGRSTKRAVLETGLTVQVPLYIEPGELVRVNTETGEVSGRA